MYESLRGRVHIRVNKILLACMQAHLECRKLLILRPRMKDSVRNTSYSYDHIISKFLFVSQECHETPPPVNATSPLLQQKDDEIDRLKRDIENLETELKLVEESNRQLMSLMQEEHDSVAMAKQLAELKKVFNNASENMHYVISIQFLIISSGK